MSIKALHEMLDQAMKDNLVVDRICVQRNGLKGMPCLSATTGNHVDVVLHPKDWHELVSDKDGFSYNCLVPQGGQLASGEDLLANVFGLSVVRL